MVGGGGRERERRDGGVGGGYIAVVNAGNAAFIIYTNISCSRRGAKGPNRSRATNGLTVALDCVF